MVQSPSVLSGLCARPFWEMNFPVCKLLVRFSRHMSRWGRDLRFILPSLWCECGDFRLWREILFVTFFWGVCVCVWVLTVLVFFCLLGGVGWVLTVLLVDSRDSGGLV